MRSKLLTTSNVTLVFHFTTLECNICKHNPSCKIVKISQIKNVYIVIIKNLQFWYKLLHNESLFPMHLNKIMFCLNFLPQKANKLTNTYMYHKTSGHKWKKKLFIFIQALLTSMNNDHSYVEFNQSMQQTWRGIWER